MPNGILYDSSYKLFSFYCDRIDGCKGLGYRRKISYVCISNSIMEWL